ncbi:MAG: hypothetical protein ABIQ02_03580 [Saprospiraceae bacterium]
MATNLLQFRKGIHASKKQIIQDQYSKIVALRKKRIDKTEASLRKLNNQFKKDMKSLITPEEKKNAIAAIKEARMTTSRALIRKKHDDDDTILKPVIAKTRASFQRCFAKFNSITATRRKFRADLNGVLAEFSESAFVLHDSLLVNLPDLVLLPNDADRFVPPYDVTEIENFVEIDPKKGHHQIADARTGFISTLFDVSFEGRDNFFLSVEGFAFRSSTAVGKLYIMPRTGILRVTIVAQNTRSFLSASLKDTFGFSDGDIRLSAGIYLHVIAVHDLGTNEIEMSSMSISSGGDDVSKTQENLQTANPFTVTLTSTSAYAQGEPVAIMVGSVLNAFDHADDMVASNFFHVAWQIKEIIVQVI